MKKTILSLIFAAFTMVGFGQITTSTISGVVKNEKNEALVGATIHAVHQPTGTEYKTTTNKSGATGIKIFQKMRMPIFG